MTQILKDFADDNSKFDENGIVFSNRVENTMGKGDIAHYCPPPRVFKRLVLHTCKNKDLFGKGLINNKFLCFNPFPNDKF